MKPTLQPPLPASGIRTPTDQQNSVADSQTTLHVQAKQFDAELREIHASTTAPNLLRKRTLNCLVKHHSLIGGAFYKTELDGSFTTPASVLDHPFFRQKAVQAWLQQLASQALADNTDVVTRCDFVRNAAAVVVPFQLPEQQQELLVLLTTCEQADNDARIERCALAAHATVWSLSQWNAQQQLTRSEGQLRVTAALLELASTIDSATDFSAASQLLVDQLCDYIGCDSVVFLQRQSGRATGKIRAVSGAARFDHHSPKHMQMLAALNESLVRNSNAVVHARTESYPAESLALKSLLLQEKYDDVATIPLHNASGQAVAALCLVNTAEAELSSSELSALITTASTALGPTIEAAFLRQPNLWRRMSQRLFRGQRQAVYWSIASLLAVIFVLMLPFPYRLACEFECEAVCRKLCVAPYDGLLKETLVQPGDIVRTGQVLAMMDDEELLLELNDLAAERQKHEKERLALLAEERVAESYVSALEIDRIQHRRELLKHRSERLELTSQTEGVILAGATDKRENFPVKMGDSLFEIAPLSPLRMEIAVPDEDINQVQVGMEVEFRPASDLSQVIVGKIQKIRPQTEIRDDQNVFVAEVEYANQDHKLRPGMKGHARIQSGRYSLAWNLFHKAWEQTLVKVWW